MSTTSGAGELTDDVASTPHLREQLAAVLEKVGVAARPGSVFGQPVISGSYTVITASEVASGGGFGFGGGRGPASRAGALQEGQSQESAPLAGGSGGGGGGGSSGRPVAVIIIGPDGVKVRPIVDPTKIALAALTAWGAVALAIGRIARRARAT